jgi:hypothetical protein
MNDNPNSMLLDMCVLPMEKIKKDKTNIQF